MNSNQKDKLLKINTRIIMAFELSAKIEQIEVMINEKFYVDSFESVNPLEDIHRDLRMELYHLLRSFSQIELT